MYIKDTLKKIYMLIEKAKKKLLKIIKNSGYARVFNSTKFSESISLVELIMKVHGTAISNGSELERLIYQNYNAKKLEKVLYQNVDYNDDNQIIHCLKIEKVFKKNIHIDIVHVTNDTVYFFELKDGYDFDTEKSKDIIEKCESLENLFIGYFEKNGIDKKVVTKVILFNSTKSDIKNNKFKGVENCEKYLENGEYLCENIHIDIKTIHSSRIVDRNVNFTFLIDKIVDIFINMFQNEKYEKDEFVRKIALKLNDITSKYLNIK
jgi:hypothetical protein